MNVEPTHNAPPPVSISEAAKVLGVSASTLRRWESEGKIRPARTLGGQRRYSLEELQRIRAAAYRARLASTEVSA